MTKKRGGALLALALISGAAIVMTAAATSSARTSAVPSWCGSKKIKMGFTDGFGGNSWRLVTTASARAEAKKCPSVTELDYADGQGNTQKAISDIQGMVAKGVNALVVFPDAGKAILPALTSAYKAGVVTVPYRVTPGGKAGVNYNAFIDTPFPQAGENWGRWILKVLPKGGNVLMLSGPKGNSQGVEENQGLHKILDPSGKYKFIGEKPFEVTDWDPAKTQKVLSAAIAKYPKIDVIVSDRPLARGRSARVQEERADDPGARDLRRQRARVLLAEEPRREPDVQAVHGLDAERPRAPRDGLRDRARHGRQEAGHHALPVVGVRGLDDGQAESGGVQGKPAG
jgi:ABC-type sugar transport system substrate-binding protein